MVANNFFSSGTSFLQHMICRNPDEHLCMLAIPDEGKREQAKMALSLEKTTRIIPHVCHRELVHYPEKLLNNSLKRFSFSLSTMETPFEFGFYLINFLISLNF
ncbi:hypothetical protein AVEN_153370-1 [Araneus ventricosus]|uniref:Uncharacterized protein n=1 Tax=Araneus ventricosus TaxID=182803 RepID=A0A4Y2WEV2_ARAVE|nr:hypothetical protein AVEN_153370-1 [Araneus ventricosus]